ncbi:MAG: LiaI-LiaF-like domain-containing protein [Chloroflexota bacterium]
MRRGNLFWGFVLIIGGAVLLLNSMGFFRNIDIWNIFWPTFLILLGIWLIVGRLFWHAGSQSAEVALDGANHGRVVFKHGAGRLTVRAGDETGELLKGEFGGGIDVGTRRHGDQLEATLSVPPASIPWFGGAGYTIDWDVALNRQVPLSLEFNTGAGENNFDLTHLQVEEVHLQTGASSSVIRLPDNAGFTRLSVESGAASVSIHVPENVAARIRTSGGLASFNINTARFPRSGEINQSIDYETAANKADIDIQTGVGSVDVQ